MINCQMNYYYLLHESLNYVHTHWLRAEWIHIVCRNWSKGGLGVSSGRLSGREGRELPTFTILLATLEIPGSGLLPH